MTEDWLPSVQFRECHARRHLVADAEALLTAAEQYDDREDPVMDTLLRLREWPARTAVRLGFRNASAGRPRFGLADFVRLQRSGDTLAYGLVGRFWRPDFGLETIASPEAFRRFDRPGVAKLVLRFDVLREPDGTATLRTETSIHCPDARTRALLTPYWYAIRPASGWLRHRILAAIARRTSQAASSRDS